jgi:prepilin-type N-terminal cleavage/methylation domain-containing protein
MSARPSKSSTGFTLIELMVAVVLLALLTGMAALSFVRPIRAARAHQTIELLRRADATAREEGHRFGRPVLLDFDLNAQTLTRDSIVSRIPASYTIRELRTSEGSIYDGEYSLHISPLGLSRTYALHLVGPDSDQWLMVAGLSGEATTTNETTVEQLLRRASRHDAH